jgi:hypothetical protein
VQVLVVQPVAQEGIGMFTIEGLHGAVANNHPNWKVLNFHIDRRSVNQEHETRKAKLNDDSSKVQHAFKA